MLTFPPGPPGNGVSLRRKYFSRGEMSRKTPQNREKPTLQRENVPRSTPKPGETDAAEGECPGKHPPNQEKPQPQRKNVPGSTPKPGETVATGRRGSTDAKKTPSQQREGVFYLNGRSELTAEVVEQDVL